MTDPIAKSDGELSRKPTGKSSWVIRATREEDCEGITELVNMPGFRPERCGCRFRASNRHENG